MSDRNPNLPIFLVASDGPHAEEGFGSDGPEHLRIMPAVALWDMLRSLRFLRVLLDAADEMELTVRRRCPHGVTLETFRLIADPEEKERLIAANEAAQEAERQMQRNFANFMAGMTLDSGELDLDA